MKRSLSKGIAEGYIESLPIAEANAPIFTDNANYTGRFSNCISPTLTEGSDLCLLRNTVNQTPNTISCASLKFNLGRILNKYQLCPHQLYVSPPGHKYLPLIDSRDPRKMLFEKGIKTYHGNEKMPYMCGAIELSQPNYNRISLYRSEQHRAETQINSSSLSKLLEWRKTRDNHRKKYFELVNNNIIGRQKKKERERLGVISINKDTPLGVSAILPKKYKLPSPSKIIMKRNMIKSTNESTN